MTKVDFYILSDMTKDAALRFACRLSLKAFQSGSTVHVNTNDDDEADSLDKLMWDYPKHRFLPHTRIGVPEDIKPAPVHIGCADPHFSSGLMINLSDEVPPFFGRFDRVAEIVVSQTRGQGRERYAHYRHRGYPLHHHELDGWEDG